MSFWNGIFEDDGGNDWQGRFIERFIDLVGPAIELRELAEADWREHGDESPEEAAEQEARQWEADL